MSLNRVATHLVAQGFEEFPDPGFRSFRRTHPDGRAQRVSIFTWSNAKHAEREGIPPAYIVFDVDLGVDVEPPRLRLIQQEKGAAARRPWAEVDREFLDVIVPLWELDLAEAAELVKILAVSDRYLLA